MATGRVVPCLGHGLCQRHGGLRWERRRGVYLRGAGVGGRIGTQAPRSLDELAFPVVIKSVNFRPRVKHAKYKLNTQVFLNRQIRLCQHVTI